jgi:hypothetical protein
MNLSDLHVPPHSIHAEQALIGCLKPREGMRGRPA